MLRHKKTFVIKILSQHQTKIFTVLDREKYSICQRLINMQKEITQKMHTNYLNALKVYCLNIFL